MFSAEELKLIIDIPWPWFLCDDRLLWRDKDSKGFKVRSCFTINTFWTYEFNSDIWEQIWKLNIQERLKYFLWRVMAEVVPTREVMVRKTGFGDLNCPICNAEVESLFHLFKEGQGVKAIAFASLWGFKT